MEKFMIAKFTYLPEKGNVWVPLTYPSRKMFRQHWKGVQAEYPNHSIRGFERIDGDSDQTENQQNYNLFMEEDDHNCLRNIEVWRMLSLGKQASLIDGL